MKVISLGILVAAVFTSKLGAKTNNYPQGQCTWYAAERFNVVAPEPGINWGGDAGKWFANAADKGWEVRTDPSSAAVGAIAVWAGGYQNLGHVAYVTQVAKDKRSIHIAEMNWAKPGGVTDDLVLALPAGLNRKAKDGTPYRFLGYIFPKNLGKMSVLPRR